MIRKILIGLVYALFAFPTYSLAQSAKDLGLVLTGQKFLHKPVVRDNEVYFRLSIRMRFENQGADPVIIINPTQIFGSGLREARFFRWNTDSASKRINPISVKTDEFASIVKFFDDTKPPENLTVILRPGDSFPFEEEIEVESAMFDKFLTESPLKEDVKFRGKTSSWQHRFLLENYVNRGPNFNSFQLTYEFSFLPYFSDPDFLEKLNMKWKKFGRLPIGSGGTYTIMSEPIKKHS